MGKLDKLGKSQQFQLEKTQSVIGSQLPDFFELPTNIQRNYGEICHSGR